jgi:hypothetical protein
LFTRLCGYLLKYLNAKQYAGVRDSAAKFDGLGVTFRHAGGIGEV